MDDDGPDQCSVYNKFYRYCNYRGIVCLFLLKDRLCFFLFLSLYLLIIPSFCGHRLLTVEIYFTL